MTAEQEKRAEELRCKYGVVLKSFYATPEQELAVMEEVARMNGEPAAG